MRYKGIVSIALCLALARAAFGADERILLASTGLPQRLAGADSGLVGGDRGGKASVAGAGDWILDNAVSVRGYRGGMDYVLAPAEYRLDLSTDLLLHFESTRPADVAAHYRCAAGSAFAVDTKSALLGRGAARFRGPSSALSLNPLDGALLKGGSRFRDFSIEFWLYPAVSENGEVILEWKSFRRLTGAVETESFSCVVSGGRLAWSFSNFFEKPVLGGGTREELANRVELRAKSPLVPKTWSHHLLRYDGDTGLLEYLVDGVTEATAYATADGHEAGGSGAGGSVFTPAIGADAPLQIGVNYSGLMDEFRMTSASPDRPALTAYGRDPGLVISPVIDLGVGHSRLKSIEAVKKTPGNSSIELSYRISDDWVGWNLDTPEWQPVRSGQSLPSSARGRYVQIRAELFPDGTGKYSPSLSSYLVHFEPDELPPPPARIVAVPGNGRIEIKWSRVPDADVAGYLIYYGSAPGEYYGESAAEGASPIDAGNVISFTLSGLPNGQLVYIVIAAYDAAASPGAAASRAGEFSREVSARPSRTAE